MNPAGGTWRDRLPRLLLVLSLIAASSSSSATDSATPTASLVEAEAALHNGDPDAALLVLARPTGPMPLAMFVEHRRLLATARAFVGDVDGAVAAFIDVLSSSPGFTVPYTASPKVTVAFEQARAARRAPIALTLSAPALARPEEPIVVEIERTSDPAGAVTRIALEILEPVAVASSSSSSSSSSSLFSAAAPPAGGRVRFAVPAPAITALSATDDAGRPGVLLRLRARGLDDDGVERFVGAPITVPVGFAASASPWESPWTWVALGAGVVVVGAGAAAIAVVASDQPADVPVDVTVRR